ncbi:MAG: hypothetical protein Solivirus8_3 [Solivirus sp.]|uniref:Uncharacterized protein n=1 Tax=Solivirus sp. TaxID=2487772 RepID=A0A3G5AG23_9VIRU|nr:MAG: hypothetical protein Solivirus8_3 [Solivirus sp.]
MSNFRLRDWSLLNSLIYLLASSEQNSARQNNKLSP